MQDIVGRFISLSIVSIYETAIVVSSAVAIQCRLHSPPRAYFYAHPNQSHSYANELVSDMP